jgi:TRAP-type C4-dicarboxylate transport system permease small subunit
VKQNPTKWVAEALVDVLIIPITAMMIHVTMDVILKYTINHPIPGTLEVVSLYYMVAIVVLPIAFIELERSSIAVDLFYDMMSPRLQKFAVAFVLLLSTLVYAGLAANTFPAAVKSFRIHELVAGAVNLIVWPAKFLMPVAFAVAALVCLMHLIRFLTSALARDELISHVVPGAEHEAE